MGVAAVEDEAVPRDMSELRMIANPLIWALFSRETLISRLSMVPFADEPRRTAGGGAWPVVMEPAGTGVIPRA